MSKNTTKVEIVLQGHRIGSVKNGVFYRTLKPAHFLKFPPGVAQSVEVLDKLQEMGVTHLEFKNGETGVCYRCTLKHFQEAGFPLDRGHGKQVALPLTGFTVQGVGDNHPLEAVYVQAARPEATQLSLFGGYA